MSSDEKALKIGDIMVDDFYRGNPIYEMGVQAERQRILSLPCMEEEEHKHCPRPYEFCAVCNDNDLRRELKEEINP